MGNYSYKRAYKTACAGAGVDFRLYDARHTFVTRLAENPTVNEETIRQLAGHVSPRMLARYAHIRAKAARSDRNVGRVRAGDQHKFRGRVPTKSPTVVG